MHNFGPFAVHPELFVDNYALHVEDAVCNDPSEQAFCSGLLIT